MFITPYAVFAVIYCFSSGLLLATIYKFVIKITNRAFMLILLDFTFLNAIPLLLRTIAGKSHTDLIDILGVAALFILFATNRVAKWLETK